MKLDHLHYLPGARRHMSFWQVVLIKITQAPCGVIDKFQSDMQNGVWWESGSGDGMEGAEGIP